MPHKFSNREKIQAMTAWVDDLQSKLDVVKSAIMKVKILDNHEDVREDDVTKSTTEAYEEFVDLAERIDRFSRYYVRFEVARNDYNRALTLVKEHSEVIAHNGRSFSVQLWGEDRARNALNDANIRFTISGRLA